MKKVYSCLLAFSLLGASTLRAQNSLINTVIITAPDARASEGGGGALDTGTFEIRRNGPTNLALYVFYRISGSASNGVDYEHIADAISIPEGSYAASITIRPIDDTLVEGPESVVLQLIPSPLACPGAQCGYNIGSPSNAVVVIADNDQHQTNQPPFVQLNAPYDGEQFTAPVDITLRAFAQDPEDGYNVKVEFFAGDHSLGFGTFVPTLCPSPLCPFFSLTWSNVPPGNYVLTAKTTDQNGNSSVSNPARISVTGNDHPGVVNIYAVDAIATEGPATTGNAPDTARFVVRRSGGTNESIVVYYDIGGTASNGDDYEKLSGEVTLGVGVSSADIIVKPIDDNLVEDTETVILTLRAPCPPCLFANPPCDMPEGTNCYPIGPDNHAVAYIRDNDQGNIPPAVAITAPHDGAVFPSPSDIEIHAVAVDQDGYVSLVEFFEGTNKIGESQIAYIQAPPPGQATEFTFLWTNVLTGTYVLTAKATDSEGATGVSRPVRIFVGESNRPPATNLVAIFATDAIAVEGQFCVSNWWWTTSGDTNGWNTTTPGWRTNYCTTNTATFVVRRSGDTNADLTVPYSIGGTASNGVDYVTLPGKVTIPAGHRAAEIVVVPIDDNIPEHIETVVLTLQLDSSDPNTPPTATHGLGFPSRAAAVILDNDEPRPPCRILPGGLFHVCGPGTNGYTYCIRTSADLKNWTSICTNVVTDGAVHFVDPDSTDFDHRFYQVVPDANYAP